MTYQIKQRLVLLIIILIATLLRFTGVNWDQSTHLHPDERFLTMVGTDLKITSNLNIYLDPKTSTLNPINVLDEQGNKKYSFFVYGSLPITINKIFAVATDNDTYHGFTLSGRILSAFFDLLTVLLLFKIIEVFEKNRVVNKNVKYWAAFFYAVSVLPIQLSHFFAVDTFLTFFLFMSLYLIIRFYYYKNYYLVILSGVFLGFAFASKVTAVFFLPLLLSFICFHFLQKTYFENHSAQTLFKNKKVFLYFFISLILFLGATYISLRLTNPYMFEDASFLNPQISKLLMQNWKTLKSWEAKDVWFPPAIQWLNRTPILFSLWNMAVYGIGLPYFFLVIIGSFIIIIKKRNFILVTILLWSGSFFMYQSTQAVKAIRYFIFMYPFLALLAAIGWNRLIDKQKPQIKLFCLLIILIWPISFVSIYIKPHSRIKASEWIYNTLPSGSTIAWEVWDDPLPLILPYHQGKFYNLLELHVFDPDTPEKWEKLNSVLSQSDYYILSSNRAWGSMPRVPSLYPTTTQFYKDLFSGDRGFIKIAEFTSYPTLQYLGIPLKIPDDSAEESFTVYDHPKVMIFKNTER
jgi:hypothetical protein